MKDWYQYRPWNFTQRVSLRKLVHMTYHTTALLPNSCGPMGDGPFGTPRVFFLSRPKYWTHRWRIDINIGHGIISTIEPSWKNQGTWHIIRRHFYQIDAAQWRMVNFGTPRVGSIHTPNIGPIDKWLISISTMKSNPYCPIKKNSAYDI